MSEPSKLRPRLISMGRDELNVVAKKLKVKGFRKKNKDELIELLISEHAYDVQKHLNITWWDRHSGHVYGAGGILLGLVSVIIGIVALVPMFHEESEFDCVIKVVEIVPDNANDVMDGSDIENWKVISTDERSTIRLRVENRAKTPVTLEKGTILIESFRDPLDGKTPIVQVMRCSLMDHKGHHVATIGKMEIGEQAMFPINRVIPAESPIELVVWVRLVEAEKPPVSFVDAKVRLYGVSGDKVDSDLVRLEIHEMTEEFVPKMPEVE